jgi:hypothetical protein
LALLCDNIEVHKLIHTAAAEEEEGYKVLYRVLSMKSCLVASATQDTKCEYCAAWMSVVGPSFAHQHSIQSSPVAAYIILYIKKERKILVLLRRLK